jgi:hypothetical protein
MDKTLSKSGNEMSVIVPSMKKIVFAFRTMPERNSESNYNNQPANIKNSRRNYIQREFDLFQQSQAIQYNQNRASFVADDAIWQVEQLQEV